ncbi:stage II sporulation protein M [Ignisphaera sp. 4213-co]|uniref:Stage II sporulation protein M n=1 Tax=Ignisphaera cupida TaxID=3050454 RepID=A0ABD4Z5G6_9CREN|nr:stage II sporulation protein M [Ignisphaera sp. 4213-co]MDK6028359.1 stage II sporulation protein M [Ignisphaera sp. 4213-co]
MSILKMFVNDLPLIGAVLVFSIIFFSVATLFIDVPQQFVDTIRDEVKKMESIARETNFLAILLAIFSNNAQVNIMISIPFLNIVMYPTMILSTAWALRVYVGLQSSKANIFNDLVYFLALLFLMPHFYIEFFSYSLSLVASMKLAISMLKKEINKEKVRYFLFLVVFSMALLFIAAFIEATLMRVLASSSL